MTQNYVFCLFGLSVYFVVRSAAIIDGHFVRNGNARYQVSLKLPTYEYHCGGCIIGDDFDYILTAAHCVINDVTNQFYPNIIVAAGILNLHQPPMQTTTVEEIFVPNTYSAPGAFSTGDIAILKVRKSLSEFASLKIPQQSGHTNKYQNKTARFSGFGWTWVDLKIVNNQIKPFGNNTHGHLQSATATVLRNVVGQKLWATNTFRYRILDETLIYARINPRIVNTTNKYGVCVGDGGGPLVYQKQVVIGVLHTSNLLCDERLLPAVYTRITAYRHFIDNAMSKRNLYTMRVHPPQ